MKGTRVSGGKNLLTPPTWIPSRKRWRNACKKAILFIRIFGKDTALSGKDPAQVNAQFLTRRG